MNDVGYITYLRIPNLALMLLLLYGVQFCMIPYLGIYSLLSNLQFILLGLSMVCLASFGNLQNDYVDKHIDRINRPEKSKFYSKFGWSKLQKLYIFLGSFGFVVASSICLRLGLYNQILLFLGVIGVLHAYNHYLKLSFILGNAAISILVAVVVLVPFFFIEIESVHFDLKLLIMPLVYFSVSFMINFAREIVKDIEDRKGDYALKGKTIVLQIGIRRSAKVLSFLIFVSMVFVMTCYYLYFPKHWESFSWLVIILIPQIIAVANLQKKEERINWSKLSNLFKVTLLLGSMSLFGFCYF